MSFKNASKLGHGIIKLSSRPTTLVVDSHGEYWVCDVGVNEKGDLKRQGCISYSERPFSEGG